MGEIVTLNIQILYELHQGTFNPQKYNPSDLDVDLRNLADEGLVSYSDMADVTITEFGRNTLVGIMNQMIDSYRRSVDDFAYPQTQ